MHPDDSMARIINRKHYSVKNSTLIASDEFWDGSNFEHSGRNTFLYRTLKGYYFTVTLTMWQGERDVLEPVSQEEALSLYENDLSEHLVNYKDAFPDVQVEET